MIIFYDKFDQTKKKIICMKIKEKMYKNTNKVIILKEQ